MENIKLMIETTNDAFADGNEKNEVARILRELADKLENGNEPTIMRDYNGNVVGTVIYS
jgi:hypothetical protein